MGAEAEFIYADVRNEQDVSDLVDGTVARFGRLDVAVNNAGTEGKPGPLTEQSAESYAATFDTNVLGTVLSLKHEMRAMQAQGHGSIINLSSTMGHKGAPGASIYTASKHAVEAMSDRLLPAKGCFWKSKKRDRPPNSPRSRLPKKTDGLHCDPRSVPGSRPAAFAYCCSDGTSSTARV